VKDVCGSDLVVIADRWSSPMERERRLGQLDDRLELSFHRSGDARNALRRSAEARSLLEGVADDSSSAFARLLNFEARMALAAGDKEAVDRSRPNLHVARSILERQRFDTVETIRLYVDTVLNESVSLKAVGAFDESLILLRDAQNDAVLRRVRSELDIMPLYRQEVMMIGTRIAHQNLAQKASPHRSQDALDYFGSVKRVFEYALNRGDIRSAKRLFAVLVSCFEIVRSQLTPLARVSFLKNGGQLAASLGEQRVAERRLEVASHHAARLGLRGQEAQILLMLEAVRGGDRPQLPTFRL
jgi:hypothetical protein